MTNKGFCMTFEKLFFWKKQNFAKKKLVYIKLFFFWPGAFL
jgi:hypothetical protein